ncbi:protein maternal effect lethal 26-like [Paramacrobiotus metropolitanus]|uniref:protein maternal effect lethal 26-like n=1 Tax=Paramacrobiotus metropolitanus TaxID=2943436 RepID=UPI002445653D|nr:protein maternal effect lethal 26-like [Paramacrobiotus metropolitanus]
MSSNGHGVRQSRNLANFVRRQQEWLASEQHRRNADFILRSNDGKKFPAHKFLLMAHSPVFAAMLTHDTKEIQQGQCDLLDTDGQCVEVLLDFLYSCGSMGKITVQNAEKVLVMADKYQIDDLCSSCEVVLAGNVAAEKAMHYLILASRHRLPVLKEAALRVIPKNLASLLKGNELEKVCQSDPEVIRLILEHCSKKMRVVEPAPVTAPLVYKVKPNPPPSSSSESDSDY